MKRLILITTYSMLIFGFSCSKRYDWMNPLDPANDLPPNVPTNYNPFDGTQGVNPYDCYFFYWFVSDPNPGDYVTSCDVYLGSVNPPPYFVQATYDANGGTPLYIFHTDNLQPLTTYYWRVVLRDNHKKTTSTPIWSFTTGY